MIKIPKDMIIEKIKEKTNLSDAQIQSKIKDKLDQLSGLISEEGALHIIANELGVKILEDPGELQVKNVLAGMRNVQLTGKVVQIYEVREFEKGERKGKVGNFMVGDETGTIRIVAWNEKTDLLGKLKEGDIVKIENGYSRDNRGRAEIHLGDKTVVEISPKDAKDIEVKPRGSERKKIQDLSENEDNVEIMGTIVQVFDPRFFTVDPESGKRVTEKEGKFYLGETLVEKPDYSYVTNLFLDDGTENIRVVLWKNQTQNLFGMTHEQILTNQDIGFEEIKNELLGKIVKFSGRTNKNEMFDRVEFIVRMVFANPDPDEEIERLNKELETTPEQPKEDVVETPKQDVVEEIRIGEDKLTETIQPEEKVEEIKPDVKEETVVEETPVAKEKVEEPVEKTQEEVKPEPVKEEISVSDTVLKVQETQSVSEPRKSKGFSKEPIEEPVQKEVPEVKENVVTEEITPEPVQPTQPEPVDVTSEELVVQETPVEEVKKPEETLEKVEEAKETVPEPTTEPEKPAEELEQIDEIEDIKDLDAL